MDFQVLFNVAVGVASVLGGWVLNRIYVSIDKLDVDVRSMPHTYVQKDDFKTAISDIKTDIRSGFAQIDKTLGSIFDRLNEKADK
ncbi:MAG: hypothetical protein ABFD94_01810 [Armatimonadia bacterium]